MALSTDIGQAVSEADISSSAVLVGSKVAE